MIPSSDNFYAGWRRVCLGAGNVLREENQPPSERLLQAIWHHQRLHRDRLKTVEGRTVRVLHPGFVSVEGGPDFRGAVIQIGDEAPRSGDVEIDLRVGGWRAHGHDRNPDFRNVLLHVVWEGARPRPGAPPVLPLSQALDAPLDELGLGLENELPRTLPENLRGQCCAVLRELDETRQTQLLGSAARVRFEAKAGQFRARARDVGWEQALWEGLFRALGYKHNVWPMHHLAESRGRWRRGAEPVFALQARLLGLSGLLPAELRPAARGRVQTGSDAYVRKLWDGWWRERDEFSDCVLPRAVWKFHGLRPANHPQRRLALAAHWLAADNLVSKIERWCAAELSEGGAARPVSPARLIDSLRRIFEVEHDEFWSWHWTFHSARLKQPQPLLGDARVTDLAVNVVLPWLWTRAAEGRNEEIQRRIEHRFALWPPAEDNAILKLARQRLLGVGQSRAVRSAFAQQGLIQITRDFCEQSNAVCENCRFPELVRGWGETKITSRAG